MSCGEYLPCVKLASEGSVIDDAGHQICAVPRIDTDEGDFSLHGRGYRC